MWEIIDLGVVEGGGGGKKTKGGGVGERGGGENETQGWGLEDTKQGLILGALFFEKGVPRKGVQKVFELIGTDCSMRK